MVSPAVSASGALFSATLRTKLKEAGEWAGSRQEEADKAFVLCRRAERGLGTGDHWRRRNKIFQLPEINNEKRHDPRQVSVITTGLGMKDRRVMSLLFDQNKLVVFETARSLSLTKNPEAIHCCMRKTFHLWAIFGGCDLVVGGGGAPRPWARCWCCISANISSSHHLRWGKRACQHDQRGGTSLRREGMWSRGDGLSRCPNKALQSGWSLSSGRGRVWSDFPLVLTPHPTSYPVVHLPTFFITYLALN